MKLLPLLYTSGSSRIFEKMRYPIFPIINTVCVSYTLKPGKNRRSDKNTRRERSEVR